MPRVSPTTIRKEVHTESMPLRQPDDVVMPGLDSVFVPEPEAIAVVERPDTKAGEEAYNQALKFNEDLLTIVLEPSAEENAPQFQDVSCNGRIHLIPVGEEYTLPRKFVEILILAMPYSVRTIVESPVGQDPINRITKRASAKFPLSILHDPAGGRGTEWLRRLRAQG